MKHSNLVVITVTCEERPERMPSMSHDHTRSFENIAPSKALHDLLVLIPCTGDFTVAMTVLETTPATHQVPA